MRGVALTMSDLELKRHFTATGFVVDGDAVLLHWHAKIKAWLPPGGHVEANEDPVQAVLREIKEETGLSVEIVGSAPDLGLAYPEQVAPPYTIMVEDIDDPVDGFHQHIDMIYFCRPLGALTPLNEGWRRVTRRDLAAGVSLVGPGGQDEPPPRDVRVLAERAFTALGRV
jgi:8-oxo-dGTP pyrophosphatase MutT (NUDIX family)